MALTKNVKLGFFLILLASLVFSLATMSFLKKYNEIHEKFPLTPSYIVFIESLISYNLPMNVTPFSIDIKMKNDIKTEQK